jgi:hypothetical protein
MFIFLSIFLKWFLKMVEKKTMRPFNNRQATAEDGAAKFI